MSNSNVSLLENTAPLDNRTFIDRHPVVDQCQSVWQQFSLRIPQIAFYPDTIIPHSRYLREVFSVVDNDDIDAVLLTNEKQSFGLEKFRSARDLFLVPVVNVSGKPSVAADVDFSLKNPKSWVETASCIRKFRDRRGRLSSRFLSPTSPAVRMMAYLFVSGEDLTPVRQPNSRTISHTKVFRIHVLRQWLPKPLPIRVGLSVVFSIGTINVPDASLTD